MKKLLLFLLLLSGFIYSQPGGLFPHSVSCWHLSQNAIDCLKDTVFNYITPIPIDSLADSTITVSADSGLGGGGTTNLGDTVNVRVHVDSVTIDIFKDTLRVDTSNIATKYYVNDTLTAYWDTTNVKTIVSDSSQYYYWRAKSKYRFPEYDDMVLWDYNDFQTGQDSVDVCYFVEYATNYNYLLAEKDAAATDSQYIHLHWSFIAPRDVSDITDTLFIFRYKTTSADTLNCGALPIIVEGTTVRYKPTEIVASTAWDTIAVLKSYGTLNLITEGDQFSLDIRFKVDGDSCYGEMLEERWY
jgi:hypothetical protein